jgi:PPK2 family polyphosphate:nucleotide phosphotransferase
MNLLKLPTGPDKSVDEVNSRNTGEKNAADIGEQQVKLYAEANQSLLVIFQGMDAAGKDGAIKKVFKDVNPMGCHVVCFKKPTPIDYSHDFLWRIHKHTPPDGMIHVFNRSHYEDIIVPTIEKSINKKTIEKRYDQINDFEKMLEDNGTRILKFFLHVSKDEQKRRLEERLTIRSKFWKHQDADWIAREKWNDYLDVYEDIFKKCDKIPWHIIPSDKNWYKEMLVSEQVIKTLDKMNPQYPDLISNMK